MNIVPDAIVYSAVGAPYQRQVREVSAVVALVSILVDLVSIVHELDCGVAGRQLVWLLDGDPRAHLCLHESALADLEVGVLSELRLEQGACLCVDRHSFQVPNVFRHQPLDGEDGDLFARTPVDLLALGPELEP